MPLRNACFISYRHGQYDLINEFTTDFYDALLSEIEPMLGSNTVFMDRNRLRGGYFFNEVIARNLYESATMVLLYTPTYFSADHTYCAREYKAMEALEAERLAILGPASDKHHGLIIPVILRGAKHLPEEIRLHRQYYDFESFQLGGRHLSRHPKFAPAIREIANYICDRYNDLCGCAASFETFGSFRLPSEEDVRSFLTIGGQFRAPFPRGGGACATTPAL